MGEIGTLRQRLLCLNRMIIEQTEEAHLQACLRLLQGLGDVKGLIKLHASRTGQLLHIAWLQALERFR